MHENLTHSLDDSFLLFSQDPENRCKSIAAAALLAVRLMPPQPQDFSIASNRPTHHDCWQACSPVPGRAGRDDKVHKEIVSAWLS